MTLEHRRSALLDRIADYLLAEGLGAASLRPLAKAVGVSDRMLIYYFRDKNALFEAALGQIAARLTAALQAKAAPNPLPSPALRAHLAGLALGEALWPYMRLWLELASLAARGDPLCQSVGERLGRGFLHWIASQLESDDPEADAGRLLLELEGAVLLRSVGLQDVALAGLGLGGGQQAPG